MGGGVAINGRFVLAAMMIVVWAAGVAEALPMVDQEHDLIQSVGGTTTFTDFEVGQTFTVGQSGVLSQVDLALGTIGTPLGDVVTVDIRDVLDGLPVDGAPLYQTTIPLSSVPPRGGGSNFPLIPIDLTAGNLAVSAGEQLAIVVSREVEYDLDNSVLWERGLPGYAAGESMTRFGTQAWSVHTTPRDYGFRTWVDTATGPPGPDYRLFETTRPLPPDDMFYTGLLVDSGYYAGVNFEVVRPTRINSVGARFVAGAPEQVFAAIVALDDRNGAPDPTDLSGDDVLGTTLIDLPEFSSGPTDASGELELTLSPGFYGLWFGSGQFGASGDGFLYSENDPVGAWSLWTLQQPSGNRNFISSDVRLFVDASSAPGTVQLRSAVDVAAEDFGSGVYTLFDGEASIELNATPSGSVEKRGVLEFDISGIPAGAVIESALFEVHTNGYSTNGVSDPQMLLYGYMGDGVADPADALQIGTLVGTSPALEDLGLFAANIDPAFVQSLLGSDYLGLVARGANDNSSLDFYPTENRGFGEPPLLTIVLSVPGDYNGDLEVDEQDYAIWVETFGSTDDLRADGNGNQVVDAADYTVWRDHRTALPGSGAFGSAEVPEPASLALLLAAAAAVASLRTRTRG